MVTNQCIRLTNSLSSFTEQSSKEDLHSAAMGVMAAMANIQGVIIIN